MKRFIAAASLVLLLLGQAWAQTTGSAVGPAFGCAGRALADVVYTNVSLTANTQLITGTANQRHHICHVDLIATGGANNVALVTGTGATCGTGTAGLFGGATAATGWGFAANGGLVLGDGVNIVRRSVTTGDNLCLFVSAATQVSGLIVSVQF